MPACLTNDPKIFTFCWNVKNLQYSTLERGESIKSPSFKLHNFKTTSWHLQLYPKGTDENSAEYISIYLIREEDKGPEIIDIKTNFSTQLYKTEYAKNSFKMHDKYGYEKFLSFDMDSVYTISLDIECEMHFNDFTAVDGLSPALKSEVQQSTKTIKEESKIENMIIQANKISKELFVCPTKSFASSQFSFEKKQILWPVDELLISDDDYHQILPIFASEYSLSLTITIKKRGDSIKAEIYFKKNNKKACLLAICKLNLSVEEKEPIMLFEGESKFQNVVRSVWCLDEIIKVSDLETRLDKSFLSQAKWSFEFTFANGDVHSDLIREEYSTSISEYLPTGSCKVSEQMLQYYNESKLCDASIKGRIKTFRAHLSVISEFSPVLADMFSGKDENTVIEITDFEDDVMSNVIDFMYTGTISNLQFSDAQKLFSAALKYEIKMLIKLCRNVLVRSLAFDNVLQVLALANEHNDLELETATIRYIYLFKNQVLESDEWKQFQAENVQAALDILLKLILVLRNPGE